jgi:ketosteroid isomerase-like protein
MSQENVEALRLVYAGWSAGDHTAGAQLWDDHVVAVVPDPSPVPHYGIEALQVYFRDFLAGWQDLRFVADRFRESNGSVLVDARLVGAGKRSGLSLDTPLFHVWTFRGGKVLRFDVVYDEDTALEAVGLSE